MSAFGVVLNLKHRIVELRLPFSEDRMSLLISSVSSLPVVAHIEASPDLASIHVVYEFPNVFSEDLLGFIGVYGKPKDTLGAREELRSQKEQDNLHPEETDDGR